VPDFGALTTPWADALHRVHQRQPHTLFEGPSWSRTICEKTIKGRYRAHGAPIVEVELAATHKRRRSVRQAVASGVQTRRVAYPPIYDTELHPGEAASHACSIPFPFDAEIGLDAATIANIDYIATHRQAIIEHREQALHHWTRRAHELHKTSLDILERLPTSNRKVLRRGRQLGEYFHVALFREMLDSIGYPDAKYIDEIIEGLWVTGPVAPSHVWDPEPDPNKRQAKNSVAYVLAQAWDYRAKVEGMTIDEYSDQIRKDQSVARLDDRRVETPEKVGNTDLGRGRCPKRR